MRELINIGVGAAVGVALGYAIGRNERFRKTEESFGERAKSLLARLENMKERLEVRLAELDQAITDENNYAIERKLVYDRKGSLGCLARKRDLKKEYFRIQGLVTALYGHIMRLECQETFDDIAMTQAESEIARVEQLEEIEGDMTDYRIQNFLDLSPRPKTSPHQLFLSRCSTS